MGVFPALLLFPAGVVSLFADGEFGGAGGCVGGWRVDGTGDSVDLEERLNLGISFQKKPTSVKTGVGFVARRGGEAGTAGSGNALSGKRRYHHHRVIEKTQEGCGIQN